MAFLSQTSDDQGQNQNNLTPQVGNNPNQGTMPPSSPIQTGGSAASSAPGQQSTPLGAPAPSQKGSGRFTNLQKYVQANQGAGERLTSSVQKGIQQSLNPFEKQSAQQQQTGQQGIQTGQSTLQTGRGLQQTMAGEAFTPEKAAEFANQAGNVAQVGQFRTGQAVDENALRQQNETFAQANANLGQKVGEQGQLVGTESGRMNLLQNIFGGKNRGTYTGGSNRLDNLLLQSNGQNIANLESGIQNKQTDVRDLMTKASAQGKSIEQVAADEAQLAKDTQATTDTNVDKFKTGLGNQVSGFNQKLEEGIKSGNTFIDFYNKAVSDDDFKTKYGMSRSDYQFNKPLFDQFGLKQGQQTFNVLNNKDLNLGQVADIEGRRAQDWRDVANQQNVGQYDALSQLRGTDKNQYELNKASDINQAGYTQKTGDQSLQGRIGSAQKEFLDNAKNQLISGGTGYVEGVTGAGHVSLADYLKNPDYYNRAQVTTSEGGGNLDALRQFGSAALMSNAATAPVVGALGLGDTRDITGSLNTANDTLHQATNIGVGGAGLGDILSGISGLNGLGQVSQSLFGGGSGNDTSKGMQYVSQRTIGSGFGQGPSEESFGNAATGQALKDYLASQGFNNYLTEGGVQQGSNKLEDQAREFGYRNNAQGANTKEGFYNPLAERQAIMNQASQGGPLTREQIQELSATSGESARGQTRQDLIGQNKYLTSDKEYGELLNKEQGLADKNLNTQAGNRLTDIYQNSDTYNQALQHATTEDILSGQGQGRMNIGVNAAQIRGNAPQAAQDYAQNNPQFAGSEQGKQYQDYMNQLQQQRNQEVQTNLASQVYGRPTGTGDIQAGVVGQSGPLTLDQILARMNRG